MTTTIEWIPVDKDHFPDFGKNVLLRDEFGWTTVGHLFKGHEWFTRQFECLAWKALDNWGEDFSISGIADDNGRLVFTHWAELPTK